MSRSANSLTNPLYIITFAHWFVKGESTLSFQRRGKTKFIR